MKKLLYVLFLSIVIITTPTAISYALLPYEVKCITSSAYPIYIPKINDNRYVTWGESDGSDYEIFIYDGSAKKQFTNNAYDDRYSVIKNNGYIAWEGHDGNDYEIFLYDGTTTNQITNDSLPDICVSLNLNGDLAWTKTVGYAAWDMYYKFYGSTIVGVGPGDEIEINDNRHFAIAEGEQVYLYDGTNTTLISNGSGNFDICINSNDEVVWTKGNGIIEPIYFYDGSSAQPIPNSNGQGARINENGDITWHDFNDIFVYDGLSTTQITNNSYINRYPDINNNRDLVWVQYDGTNYEVLLGTPVPEPSSLLLMGLGLLAAGIFRQKYSK